MRAVIYARYSSDNQTEASIEGQIRECMEYATYNDIQVIGNYIDRAFSAKTDHRPEFQRMIKDSYKHAFDCIIVWKLDRFSRNRYDAHTIKRCYARTELRSFPQRRRLPKVRKAYSWSPSSKGMSTQMDITNNQI